jgi:large subunit ribosomal protein L9e
VVCPHPPPVQCDVWFGKKKLLAATRTVTSHINNMFLGVTTGFRYTMRFVYAHFPINANIPSDGKKVRTGRLRAQYTRRVDSAPKLGLMIVGRNPVCPNATR